MKLTKLTSSTAIKKRIQCNSRELSLPKINNELSQYNKLSCLSDCSMSRYSKLLPHKVRKNAVHALEITITASASFQGDWESYFMFGKKWANKILGGDKNCIHWAIHYDELTQNLHSLSPHIHIIYMPLINNKLNARQICGGRAKMSMLQDDFFETVGKHFGLKRGIKKYTTKTRNNCTSPESLSEEQSQHFYLLPDDIQQQNEEVEITNQHYNKFLEINDNASSRILSIVSTSSGKIYQ